MTREEIAKELNITQRKVEEIESVALKKLKKQFLEIDCEENWVDILMNTRAKNIFDRYIV